MHSVQRSGPATKISTNSVEVWAGIKRFFTERLAALQRADVAADRLIIDPGLGYFLGSTPEPSLVALGGIRRLRARFGLPVLVSPSRKSFLRALTGRGTAQIGPATLAAELFAWQGADPHPRRVTALHDALTILNTATSQASQSLYPAVTQ